MVRKIIFWSHLVAGIAAGIVIFIMSLTGVLITYEYQMVENANKSLYSSEAAGREPLSLDQIRTAASLELGRDISGVVVWNDPSVAVQATYDRRGGAFMDPYTGEFLGTGAEGVQNFLAPLRNLHRELSAGASGRAITGASNVLFIFILISGIYLWLPKIWNGATLRMRMWFQKSPANSKVRDYNWHHVFGFWALIPLTAIAVTATAISYPSVKSAISVMAGGPGQQPRPEQGQEQGPPPGAPPPVAAAFVASTSDPALMSLDALVEIAKDIDDGWYKITAAAPRDANSPAEMRIAYDFSMAPTQEKTLSLDPMTGEVVGEFGWEQMTKAQQVDQVFRRLHTGEFYGIAGQTIAGVVSIFACFMVWTGWALAWRRLVSPLIAKRKSASASA